MERYNRGAMDSWYEVAAKDWAVQNEFVLLFAEQRRPAGCAIFAEYDRGDEFIFFYFSPGAARMAISLLRRYDGTQCAPPDLSRAWLVAGDQSVTEESD